MSGPVVVWKHPLFVNAGRVALVLPRGARVLHVAVQHGRVCLWEAHPDGEPATERRVFQLAVTGWPVHVDPGRHVGSVLLSDGVFVVHVFEVDP